jgi:hypothetical protein
LGLLLLRGDELKPDPVESVSWLQKAAAQKWTDAQLLLGETLFFGRNGAKQDQVAAIPLLRAAADQGRLHAENLLGVAYENGLGVSKDLAEAVKHYQKAAEGGNAKGQSNLGRMYAYGKGMPKDPITAYKWLSLADQQNEPMATNFLRDFVKSLTYPQITEGKRQAQLFKISESQSAKTKI